MRGGACGSSRPLKWSDLSFLTGMLLEFLGLLYRKSSTSRAIPGVPGASQKQPGFELWHWVPDVQAQGPAVWAWPVLGQRDPPQECLVDVLESVMVAYLWVWACLWV